MLFSKRFVASVLAVMLVSASFLAVPVKNVSADKLPASRVVMKADTRIYSEFVDSMYEELMGRECSEIESRYWCNFIQNGEITGSAMAFVMATSDECSNGCTDEEFVARLYKGIIGREASNDEISYWINLLSEGATRSDVAISIINAPEFDKLCEDYGVVTGTRTAQFDVLEEAKVNLFVNRMYIRALGRTPERAGLKYWSDNLLNHLITGCDAAYLMFFSDEYIAKDQMDGNFIGDLYNCFFNRTPSESEKNYWMNVLWGSEVGDVINSDLTVFTNFIESPEFESICSSYGIIRGNVPAGAQRINCRNRFPIFQNGTTVVGTHRDTGVQIANMKFRDLILGFSWENGTISQDGNIHAVYSNSDDVELRIGLIRRQTVPVTIYAAVYQYLGERETGSSSTQQLWAGPYYMTVTYNWETGEYDFTFPEDADLPNGSYAIVFSTEENLDAYYTSFGGSNSYLGRAFFEISN